MNGWETQLADARRLLIDSLADALENGVSLAQCLSILGVEGKPATMLRAFLSRYNDAELAETLRAMGTENPPNEGLAVEAEAPTI